VRSRNSTPHLITAGVSFGAYLAVNFAFKHPQVVTKTVGLSGSYSIKRLLDGYYDEDSYFNCPVSYMANLNDESLLSLIGRMEISLATSDWDIGICRERTYDMSRVWPREASITGSTIGAAKLFTIGLRWRKMIGEYL
jgi:esterase/lipase superfamily enzyme